MISRMSIVCGAARFSSGEELGVMSLMAWMSINGGRQLVFGRFLDVVDDKDCSWRFCRFELKAKLLLNRPADRRADLAIVSGIVSLGAGGLEGKVVFSSEASFVQDGSLKLSFEYLC